MGELRGLWHIHHPYEFRGHLDTRRNQVGDFHQQAADLRTADGEKAAFVTVQGTADNADRTTAHRWRQLAGKVIAGGVRGTDGTDETLHLGVAHHHRTAVATANVTVLERGKFLHVGVEGLARGMNKQQVRKERTLLADALAATDGKTPSHGGEYLKTLGGQKTVSGKLGVGTLQVAEYKPTGRRHTGDFKGIRKIPSPERRYIFLSSNQLQVIPLKFGMGSGMSNVYLPYCQTERFIAVHLFVRDVFNHIID